MSGACVRPDGGTACASTKRMRKRNGQLCPARAPVGQRCAEQPTADCYTSDEAMHERRRLARERRAAAAKARAGLAAAMGFALTNPWGRR